MTVLRRLLTWLATAARAVVTTAFAVMVGAAIVQVVFRYGIGYPLGWTEELAKIMLVWWTFLGFGLLAASRRLLAIDALLLAVPDRTRHALLAFAHLVSALAIGWLAMLSARLVGLAGTQVSPALDIPYAWIYASLPVGLAVATVAFAANAVIDLRRLVRGAGPPPSSAGERLVR